MYIFFSLPLLLFSIFWLFILLCLKYVFFSPSQQDFLHQSPFTKHKQHSNTFNIFRLCSLDGCDRLDSFIRTIRLPKKQYQRDKRAKWKKTLFFLFTWHFFLSLLAALMLICRYCYSLSFEAAVCIESLFFGSVSSCFGRETIRTNILLKLKQIN